MPRRLFKKYLPEPHKLRKDKSLSFLGSWLHDPNIWHLNRRSVSGGFAVGLFMAFVPFPFGQTIAAALLAIFFRVNLPLSAALVWLTNPITMPPIYLLALQLGNWLLGTSLAEQQFEFSLTWLSSNFITLWKPFALGCMLMSIVASIIGFFGTRFVWRWHVTNKYRNRSKKTVKPNAG